MRTRVVRERRATQTVESGTSQKPQTHAPTALSVLRRLWALFYRERCVACDVWGQSPLCPTCLEAWPSLTRPLCPACGAFAPCGCAEARAYGEVHGVAAYEGVARAALHALKYRRRRALAPLLAQRLAAGLSLSGGWLVVPVPLHRSRLRSRGYNQAELLARALSRLLRQPCRDLLVRAHETRPQHALDRAQRLENLKGAFRCRRRLQGERILLVDDVLTTGATAHWAAMALLEAGASEVRVAVVARALPGARKVLDTDRSPC